MSIMDHEHIPVALDESPNSPAPSLVVCALCLETLEAVVHHKPVKSEHRIVLTLSIAS